MAFLDQKEFAGAQGLVVTDAMAVAIASQACLPLLHLATDPADSIERALDCYDDFVTIVLHPGDMVARRITKTPLASCTLTRSPCKVKPWKADRLP